MQRSSAIFGTVGILRTMDHYTLMDKEKSCLAGVESPSHLPEVLKETKYQDDARNFEEVMTDRNWPGRVGVQHSL